MAGCFWACCVRDARGGTIGGGVGCVDLWLTALADAGFSSNSQVPIVGKRLYVT